MVKVALLGATGALGRRVLARLQSEPGFTVIPVLRTPPDQEPLGAIYWDFQSPLPEALCAVDAVVNCARAGSFSFNVAFNRRLYEGLPLRIRLVNFSSNCIFARPRAVLHRFFFRGDGYIREKRAIERMARGRPGSFLLRPTVVPDEGGWSAFLEAGRRAAKIAAPRSGRDGRIKIVSAETVADRVVQCLRPDPPTLSEELWTERVTPEALLGRELTWEASDQTYFDNPLKNALLALLNSWLLPDQLVFWLQGRVVARPRSPGAAPDAIVISAMTRLYLFGAQTQEANANDPRA